MTTFTAASPLTSPVPFAGFGAAGAGNALPASPLIHVLVVEDNPVDAMRIRQLLARSRTARFVVESAATLAAAEERVTTGSVEAVLLDLDLPDSLGLATYTALAGLVPHLPVVILSRSSDEAVALQAIRLGAQDMVFKSHLSAESLARAVRCGIERQQILTSLRGQSLTDELTGLLNRRGFTTIAQGHLRLATRTGNRFLVFFFDVDDLKTINDGFGHEAGDHAIRAIGSVLRQTFRQSDVVARHGGDEFVVLALDTSGDEGATIRRRLDANLIRANGESNLPFNLAVSVGTVSYDGREQEPLGSLLARADLALYADKRRRKLQRVGPDA
ncbi:MAG: diguanylate cyclase response regulator [Gemmatimonadales bacterium]|nr:diguanylate cyclase response regulator [Gemmatimonadales bacterium]